MDSASKLKSLDEDLHPGDFLCRITDFLYNQGYTGMTIGLGWAGVADGSIWRQGLSCPYVIKNTINWVLHPS